MALPLGGCVTLGRLHDLSVSHSQGCSSAPSCSSLEGQGEAGKGILPQFGAALPAWPSRRRSSPPAPVLLHSGCATDSTSTPSGAQRSLSRKPRASVSCSAQRQKACRAAPSRSTGHGAHVPLAEPEPDGLHGSAARRELALDRAHSHSPAVGSLGRGGRRPGTGMTRLLCCRGNQVPLSVSAWPLSWGQACGWASSLGDPGMWLSAPQRRHLWFCS